jgi:hypothetical protein
VPGGLPAARERLLRYCARPPLALDRLSVLDDGRSSRARACARTSSSAPCCGALAIEDDDLTLLLVEQNVAASLGISQAAYVLENGHVVLAGSGDELLRNDGVRQVYLGL